MDRELLIFAPKSSFYFGDHIVRRLGLALAQHEERDFEDGEHKIRPLVSVRGKDVFVIHSLFSEPNQSVNDKICRLIFFLNTLRDASAERVTAVIPYLAYARKDRRSQSRDPLTSRYMAQLLESSAVNRVVTMDVHNIAAFQNAFRCVTDHLEAATLFVNFLYPQLHSQERIVVVSPDAGGVKRAEALRSALETVLKRQIDIAFFEKARAKGILRTGRIVGEVKDAAVVIVDDLISTGRTLSHAAKACKEQQATKVFAAATHGVFTSEANEFLSCKELDKILITDTIPPMRLESHAVLKKLTILPASELFADAILRIHQNESIVELLTAF